MPRPRKEKKKEEINQEERVIETLPFKPEKEEPKEVYFVHTFNGNKVREIKKCHTFKSAMDLFEKIKKEMSNREKNLSRVMVEDGSDGKVRADYRYIQK